MEKICIVKLRKKMTNAAGLEERHGQGDDLREDALFTERSRPVAGDQNAPETKEEDERGDGRTNAAERVVSLNLTREQMRELQANPSLASVLRQETTAECSAVQQTGKSVVIKFEFDSLPPLRMLKAEEVIHMLRISGSYLRRAVRQGDLRSYKFGRLRRFMLDDILAYLEAHQEITDAGKQASESRICRKEIV